MLGGAAAAAGQDLAEVQAEGPLGHAAAPPPLSPAGSTSSCCAPASRPARSSAASSTASSWRRCSAATANDRAFRPGVFLQIKLRDWAEIERTGRFTALQFKTMRAYGAQTVTFSALTLQLWDLYVQRVHRGPGVDAAPDTPLLTLYSGKPLDRVDRLCRAFSERYLGKQINPTCLRAIIATEAMDRLPPEQAAAIHRGDMHSADVVAKHYDKRHAERKAAEADAAFAVLCGGPAVAVLAPPSPPAAAAAAGAVDGDLDDRESTDPTPMALAIAAEDAEPRVLCLVPRQQQQQHSVAMQRCGKQRPASTVKLGKAAASKGDSRHSASSRESSSLPRRRSTSSTGPLGTPATLETMTLLGSRSPPMPARRPFLGPRHGQEALRQVQAAQGAVVDGLSIRARATTAKKLYDKFK